MTESTIRRIADRGAGFSRSDTGRNSSLHNSSLHTAAGKARLAAAPPPTVPTIVPPAVPAAERGYHDPSSVIQRGWSVFRLPRLQELIRLTIADLQSLPQPPLLPGESGLQHDWEGASATLVCDPVAEALRACCEELREASAMEGAEADRASHCQAVRGHIEQLPRAWSDAFSKALDGYRRAATQALEQALATASP
jgi:hypothetical protein